VITPAVQAGLPWWLVALALCVALCAVVAIGRGLWLAWHPYGAHEASQGRPERVWPEPWAGSMVLDEERALSPAGYLRGLGAIMGQTPSTNLDREPDDPYDPDDDPPWTWREQTAAELDPDALDVAHEDYDPIADASRRLAEPWIPGPEWYPEPEPEPEPPALTVAGRPVESSDEWLRRLMESAGPGWTYAGCCGKR
jgi:hypothetical protein